MPIPMHYETRYEWSGQKENGTAYAEGLPPLAVGDPAEGDAWAPEYMLVAATEICLLNTFLYIANLSKVAVKAYRSTAAGDLTFEKGKGYRFERIVIRPVLTVAPEDREKAERVLERAHQACLISRSLNCPVEVEPQFVVG